MKKICSILSALPFFVAIGCSTTGVESTLRGTPIEITRLRSEPYSFTFYSGFDQPARLVIRDQPSWEAAWERLYLRSRPVPPLPEIDFSREVVVLVALGNRATGGYGILIDGAATTASEATILVRSISPGAKCGVTAALTQPVDIARMTRRQIDVRFSERSEVQQCD